MSAPTEHKTVQARILGYAEAIGWAFVSQKAVFISRQRRAKVRGGTSREFVEHLRNPPSRKSYGGTSRGKFFDHEEKRERDLILKRKRRLRGFPDTAIRPRIPSPQKFIARPEPLSNPNSHEL